LGKPSGLGCPECSGALWEVEDGRLIRYRCRVGHAFAPETLSAKQLESLEDALWVAVRVLEEQAALASRLAKRAAHSGHPSAAERFAEREANARQRAAAVRELLTGERGLNWPQVAQ
jgi:two-component system chemotaxis response regulator CheB